ncbi:MAG: hypothetical protein EBR58_12375, partial [Betaproteobacteria bacterium]|nr:hypothetical protein [Betaproteobacteria bacterium]
MKPTLLILLLTAGAISGVAAQERIYRCGNEYTNTVTEAQAKTCKLISGGNVTVVQGQRPSGGGGGVKVASAPSSAPRIDSADQRAKDSDARLILEAELKKAEARQLELQKEYNNG